MLTFARLFAFALALALTAGPVPLWAAPVSRELAWAPTPGAAGGGLGFLELLVSSLVVFGAIRIKDVGTLANKLATRAQAAVNDYTSGVQAAGGDWEQNTANSEGNFEAGVQDAIGRKAFGKGVRAAGAALYTKRATELGSTRYGPGVAAGKDRWAQNTGPYLQMLAGLNLPPKGPRRSPQNQQRANAVALALGNMRTGK